MDHFRYVFGDHQLSYSHDLESCPDLTPHTTHMHTHMELLFFVSGKAEYRVEGAAYTLEPGDILIMRMAEAHHLLLNPNEPYERFVFHFVPELLKESLNGRLLAPFLDRPLGQLNRYSASELPADFIRQSMDFLFQRKDAQNRMRTLSYLLPVLQLIYDAWTDKQPHLQQDATYSLPRKLVAFVNEHLFELRSLSQLEDAFFLHQSRISRIFREFTGSSVWQYVQTKRLFAARDLMQSGVLPGKASVDCGYGDYSTFYRAYKKQFGCRPQEDFRRI